jgi:hypothetical protein
MKNDDIIELYWLDTRGRLCETTVVLDVAAAVERGERAELVEGLDRAWPRRLGIDPPV